MADPRHVRDLKKITAESQRLLDRYLREFGSDTAGSQEALVRIGNPCQEMWRKWRGSISKPPDLSGADLGGQLFAYYDLDGANLTNANLDRTRWYLGHADGADLSGASLVAAFLAFAGFKGCRLDNVDFRRAPAIQQSFFERTSLNGADFSGSTIVDPHFLDCDLTGARFLGTVIRGSGKPGTSKTGPEDFVALLSEEQRSQLSEKAPEVEIPPPSPKGKCFIASAACGADDDPMVATLRRFRDDVIRRNAVGRSMANLYERYSPHLALWIEESPFARGLVKRVVIVPAARIIDSVVFRRPCRADGPAGAPGNEGSGER